MSISVRFWSAQRFWSIVCHEIIDYLASDLFTLNFTPPLVLSKIHFNKFSESEGCKSHSKRNIDDYHYKTAAVTNGTKYLRMDPVKFVEDNLSKL